MKNILIISASIIVIIVAALAVLSYLGSTPLTRSGVTDSIHKLLNKEVNKKKTLSQALVYIKSSSKGYEEYFAVGEGLTDSMGNRSVLDPSAPFHVASVGKSFTATLTGVLIDESKLSLNTLITDHLDDDLLDDIFVYEGTDYRDQVTVGQLLNHTSGAADYFEDETEGSPTLAELILKEPDRMWTPQDLVRFTGDYQEAVGKPGETYHYSDTGYILLGLIIEDVSGQAFDQMLHQRIFQPLSMDNSYLMFYSEPASISTEGSNDGGQQSHIIADIWFNGENIKDYQSLSIDWSGGGVISTLDDLAVFITALYNHEIISEETLNKLNTFDHKFMRGIHYGYGFMEYHFGEYFPTLNSLPKLKGHMGVLGTQMLYDKATDTVYIASFGSTDYSAGSVQTMIKVLSTLERLRK